MSPDGVPDVPFANSISLSDITELVVSKVVVVPDTVILPETVKLPVTDNPSPISIIEESADVILLPVILIPPAVKFDIPAIVVLLAPKLIDVVPIVIAEFARFAFVIPALPDNIEFVILDIVLFEALIVLFVSVFDVPENKVSNCDNNTLPSVPPSDNNILSPTANVALSKSDALSMFTIASTAPNSSALPPEFTFKT